MRSLYLEAINIEKFDYVFRNNQNFYFITLVSRGRFCPNCHTFSKKVHSYKDKKIKHSFLIKEELTVIYHQRRYICPHCHKTFVEDNPFCAEHSHFSSSTINKTLSLLKDYNQTFSSVSKTMIFLFLKLLRFLTNMFKSNANHFKKLYALMNFIFLSILKTNLPVFLLDLKMDLY